MKTLSLNPTLSQSATIEQKPRISAIPLVYLASSICLVAGLIYGLGQMELVATFYGNIMTECSHLMMLLENPSNLIP